MKPEIIKAIFTNILFVIGVILLIFGFSRGILTLTRLVVFDEYPLQSYEESRCELDFLRPTPIKDETTPTLSEEELKERRSSCLSTLEHQRKVRMVEDLTTAFSTFVAGIVLVAIFKRNILK